MGDGSDSELLKKLDGKLDVINDRTITIQTVVKSHGERLRKLEEGVDGVRMDMAGVKSWRESVDGWREDMSGRVDRAESMAVRPPAAVAAGAGAQDAPNTPSNPPMGQINIADLITLKLDKKSLKLVLLIVLFLIASGMGSTAVMALAKLIMGAG